MPNDAPQIKRKRNRKIAIRKKSEKKQKRGLTKREVCDIIIKLLRNSGTGTAKARKCEKKIKKILKST